MEEKRNKKLNLNGRKTEILKTLASVSGGKSWDLIDLEKFIFPQN
jgi:hypothetical protein